MALVNGDSLHYRDMKKFLKNLLRNCPQNLIPSKTLVAMATKLNFLSNSLKIFSSESWSDFEIISQECSLDDPFQKVFAKF